jgi:hypothetical protein
MNKLALILALVTPAVFAGGGTVVKLDGAASIDRRGTKVKVAESTPFYQGDTLSVPEHALAQVRLEDDSVFVIPGASRFHIDAFTMPTREAGGRAVFTLLEGGVRTITGKVGKAATDKYELRTEEATITVAGSAYMVIRCFDACARKYQAGLYVKTETGVVNVGNNGGSLKLHRGQVAFTANAKAVPKHVKVSPFDDPVISSAYGVSVEFDAEVHPPRIEQETGASPS